MIKDMTDAGLVEHYHSTRAALHQAGMANNARSVMRLTRTLDITVAVARKRGLRLV